MFGIGSTELVVILVFGFLLFGPDKLPQMGRTIGRALRQFRETQEKLTAVVQTEVVDPMAAAAKKPVVVDDAPSAQGDDDADAPSAASEPVRKETFAERRARLAAERAEAEAAKAAAESEAAAKAPAADDAEGASSESVAFRSLPLPRSLAMSRRRSRLPKSPSRSPPRTCTRAARASARSLKTIPSSRRRPPTPRPAIPRRGASSNAHRTSAHAAHGPSGELRRRLTIVVASVVAATVFMYFAAPTLVDILKDPINGSLLPGEQLSVMTSLGRFLHQVQHRDQGRAHAMCTPMIIWQYLAFFLPALRPNERKWVVPAVLVATVLFFAGVVFCYAFIAPAAFDWLLAETRTIGAAMPQLEDFINTELLLMIGFGVSFELPLIVFYLAVFHIVPYASFRAAWRYVYVVMLVVSASITPDASPVTLIFMYAVMLSLYEVSLLVTRFVVVARDGDHRPHREPPWPVRRRRG